MSCSCCARSLQIRIFLNRSAQLRKSPKNWPGKLPQSRVRFRNASRSNWPTPKRASEHSVAQRKNLRIARFLNRIVFCFFAEDTGLLPANLVTEIFKAGVDDPEHFCRDARRICFATMATGGRFGKDKIRHFNGHLFEEATVFQLNEKEIGALADCCRSRLAIHSAEHHGHSV